MIDPVAGTNGAVRQRLQRVVNALDSPGRGESRLLDLRASELDAIRLLRLAELSALTGGIDPVGALPAAMLARLAGRAVPSLVGVFVDEIRRADARTIEASADFVIRSPHRQLACFYGGFPAAGAEQAILNDWVVGPHFVLVDDVLYCTDLEWGVALEIGPWVSGPHLDPDTDMEEFVARAYRDEAFDDLFLR